MNRRQFLTRVLAPAAAAVVVPELARKIFLPPRGGWPVDVSRYLTSNTAWFLKVVKGDFRTDNMRYISRERFSNQLSVPAELSERMLEDMLVALKRETDRAGQRIALNPTRLIVHPSWTPEQVAERLAQL